MYLKVVDRYNDQSISAFVTPSSKFYGRVIVFVTEVAIHARNSTPLTMDCA